jgi:hypothetical protein
MTILSHAGAASHPLETRTTSLIVPVLPDIDTIPHQMRNPIPSPRDLVGAVKQSPVVTMMATAPIVPDVNPETTTIVVTERMAVTPDVTGTESVDMTDAINVTHGMLPGRTAVTIVTTMTIGMTADVPTAARRRVGSICMRLWRRAKRDGRPWLPLRSLWRHSWCVLILLRS